MVSMFDRKLLVEMPGWMVESSCGTPTLLDAPDQARKTESLKAIFQRNVDELKTSAVGTRNEKLFVAAANGFRLANTGSLMSSVVETEVYEAARKAELPDDEIRRTLDSAKVAVSQHTANSETVGRPKKRERDPVNVTDKTYAITSRALIVRFDSWCVHLWSYCDLFQGNGSRLAGGTQYIATQLGWTRGTVITHAGHLEKHGWLAIHRSTKEPMGSSDATRYEVVHNPARGRINPAATLPKRITRAKAKPYDKRLKRKEES